MLGNPLTCGGAELWHGGAMRARLARAWVAALEWIGEVLGCCQFKGGPRASWGSVPWRRGVILGEKGGVRCAEEGDDLQVGQGSQRLKAAETGADRRGPVGRGGALAWLLGDAGRPLRAGPKERVLGRRREMERGEG